MKENIDKRNLPKNTNMKNMCKNKLYKQLLIQF